MDRRNFLSASAAASLAASSASAKTAPNQYFDLREFRLRFSHARQQGRLTEFLEKHHLPMAKRHGLTTGYFSVYLGTEMPRLFRLAVYDSLAAMEEKMAAIRADKEWTAAAKEFGSAPQPAFDRAESWLLRAFDGMPKIEVPKPGEKARLFDLRTYEAESFADVAEKINMFNTEEIAIFRKTGINPLLFGETVFGSKMPNLTYIAWYPDMAAREKAWEAFLAHPDWVRIRDKPGWGNDDIVMTVSNTYLRPLAFSPIR